MAHAYRETFGKDFLIDLVGYRRWGHNEGDEPSFTQPLMYEKIAQHPTTRAIWAQRLAAEGVVPAEEAERMVGEVQARLQQARQQAEGQPAQEQGDGGHIHCSPGLLRRHLLQRHERNRPH